MRPFLLTPASAPAVPSTLSRLLHLLHQQSRNNLRLVHAASNPQQPNNRTSSLLRRGRFFATSSSSQVGSNQLPALRLVPSTSFRMAAPTDAPGGSADAFEVIRAHQAKAARLPPVEEIRTILDRSVRGVLATHSQEHAGYPSGSMVDFACDQDGSPILAVSSLAIHSKNLSGNPKCSLLVAKDPEDRTDTVDFGDFSFLHIKPKAVRYVSGVTTAILGSGEFSAAEYKDAKVDPISQFSAPIIGHMNKDHADDTKLIVQHSINVKARNDKSYLHTLLCELFQVDFAYMLDVDSLGFNVKKTQYSYKISHYSVVQAGYDGSVLKLRVPFPRQAQDRKDVKTLIVEMLQAAKASPSQAE
ncbi:hypothetical protein PR202_ga29447 [Eleusine coracana subsp. coracana]|uniref:DUF2470 domain-containing protein n=1 Tax=Eleusine coracana subsp. coracana TaxID=191504 RepID=A0AAV5DLM1_ELECO|nr:hypothetical protein PR202_ga29447 [Eleusine coracana subsp. coracana]